MEDIILLGSLHPVHGTPFFQADTLEFKFILDVILVRLAPMTRLRKPPTRSIVVRPGQEGDLVEEVIHGLMVVLGKPSSELVCIFAVSVDITTLLLEWDCK